MEEEERVSTMHYTHFVVIFPSGKIMIADELKKPVNEAQQKGNSFVKETL